MRAACSAASRGPRLRPSRKTIAPMIRRMPRWAAQATNLPVSTRRTPMRDSSLGRTVICALSLGPPPAGCDPPFRLRDAERRHPRRPSALQNTHRSGQAFSPHRDAGAPHSHSQPGNQFPLPSSTPCTALFPPHEQKRKLCSYASKSVLARRDTSASESQSEVRQAERRVRSLPPLPTDGAKTGARRHRPTPIVSGRVYLLAFPRSSGTCPAPRAAGGRCPTTPSLGLSARGKALPPD